MRNPGESLKAESDLTIVHRGQILTIVVRLVVLIAIAIAYSILAPRLVPDSATTVILACWASGIAYASLETMSYVIARRDSRRTTW